MKIHRINKVTLCTYDKTTNTHTQRKVAVTKIKGKYTSFHYGGKDEAQ